MMQLRSAHPLRTQTSWLTFTPPLQQAKSFPPAHSASRQATENHCSFLTLPLARAPTFPWHLPTPTQNRTYSMLLSYRFARTPRFLHPSHTLQPRTSSSVPPLVSKSRPHLGPAFSRLAQPGNLGKETVTVRATNPLPSVRLST